MKTITYSNERGKGRIFRLHEIKMWHCMPFQFFIQEYNKLDRPQPWNSSIHLNEKFLSLWIAFSNSTNDYGMVNWIWSSGQDKSLNHSPVNGASWAYQLNRVISNIRLKSVHFLGMDCDKRSCEDQPTASQSQFMEWFLSSRLSWQKLTST